GKHDHENGARPERGEEVGRLLLGCRIFGGCADRAAFRRALNSRSEDRCPPLSRRPGASGRLSARVHRRRLPPSPDARSVGRSAAHAARHCKLMSKRLSPHRFLLVAICVAPFVIRLKLISHRLCTGSPPIRFLTVAASTAVLLLASISTYSELAGAPPLRGGG